MPALSATSRNRLAAGWLAGWAAIAAVFLLALLPASQNLPGLSSVGSLAYSTKNIEEIEPGDYVLAVDEEDPSRPAAAKQVVRTFQSQSDHLRILTIEGADGHAQELRTTNGHPFWVVGKGWLLAGELQTGDQFQQSDGRHATLTSTRKEDTSAAVYNFEVVDWHTYFVSANTAFAGTLVHNTSAPGHHAGWFHFDSNGNLLGDGVVDSSCPTGSRNPTIRQQNHTEKKILAKVNLKQGDVLEIFGLKAPCQRGTSCNSAMVNKAKQTGATIFYNWCGGWKKYP